MLCLCRMCIVWCLMGMYLTTADTKMPCVRFTINPSGDGRELTVEENTTRTITFEVLNTCPDLDDVTVAVTWWNVSASRWKHLCRVSQERMATNCKCEKSDLGQLCRVTDTFTRHRTQWRLRDTGNSNTVLGEEIFNVNVTYPSTITKFVLATEDTHLEVDENKEPGVQVRCQWQEGNPQRRIHIRKDGDEPLQTTETADRRLSTLLHNIKPVRCSDSGLYSCEVEGTDQHRTVTMLVRCPLQFTNGGETETVTVLPGETAEFEFSVLSYTSTISSCTLTRTVTTQNQDNTISCMSSRSEVVVIGSPPHLTLRLRLKNVEQQDEGTWRMRVDNGFTRQASVPRQADVDFTLRVASPTTTPLQTTQASSAEPGITSNDAEDTGNTEGVHTSKTSGSDVASGSDDKTAQQQDGDGGIPLAVIVGAGVAVVAVLVLVVSVVYVCRRNRKQKNDPQPSLAEQSRNRRQSRPDKDMTTNDLYVSSDPCNMIDNDLYEGSGDMRTAPAADSTYEVVGGAGAKGAAATPKPAPESNGNTYTEVGEVQKNMAQQKKHKKRPKEPAPEPSGDMYVGVAEVQRNKAQQKKKKELKEPAPEPSGDMYVGVAEVQRNKARQKKAKHCKGPAPEPSGEMYVGVAEVQRNKAQQKKEKDLKESAAVPQPEPEVEGETYVNAGGAQGGQRFTDADQAAAGNSDPQPDTGLAVVTNADGLTYGQLDFSNFTPRKTIISALPNTDYAEISFQTPPQP